MIKVPIWLQILVGVALLLSLAACERTEVVKTDQAKKPAVSRKDTSVWESGKAKKTRKPKAAKPPPPAKPRARMSKAHDEEINQILELARRNQWQEAEARAAGLYAADPADPAVERVQKWVATEGPKRRELELDNQIREVMSRDRRFNPTIASTLSDQKFPGLLPRSDLRDAVDQLKAMPYVPDTFGKTIQAKGSLEDFKTVQGHMAALLDKEVGIHLNNVTLQDLIFKIGDAEGINFIADKGIAAFQQKLTANLEQVKLREFLAYVARNMNLQFQVGDDLIWIVDAKATNKMMQETRFLRLRKGLILPAQFSAEGRTNVLTIVNNVTNKVETIGFSNFVADGAPKEPGIVTAIKTFFRGSKYVLDFGQNLIVAQGTPEQLDELEQIVENMDRPIQQVLIEARFITVTESTFLNLGVAWETGRGTVTTRSPTDYTGLSQGGVGLGLQETWTGVLGRDDLSATLTAIDQSGESETLSAPRVTLMNNLPATINDGKIQYYYQQYTVTQTILERRSTSSLVPDGKPTKINAGVELDVLASIGGDGKSIMLALHPRVNQDVVLKTFATITDRDDQGRLASSFDIKLPELRTQEISTRSIVRSGQTVIMGGVVQREQKTYVEAVPVLGRIPIIGAAFRRRMELDQPRYLLIFVTANIVNNKGEFVVPDTE